MTVQPTVSVLIPAYNVADIAPRAIRSALNQTMDALEVLVIDDASTDETYAAVEALAASDPRVRVLRTNQNAGPGAARAIGLRAARGEWVAILDADDEFRPARLERLLRAAGDKNLDAVADNLDLVDPGTGAIVTRAFPLGDEHAATITPERFLANSTPAGRINLGWMQPMVRRDFLARHAIEWRDLRHAEDLVFAMEVLLAGARFDLLGWPGYAYTQRRGAHSAVVSPHSRTRRSPMEQHRALDELKRRAGPAMSAEVRDRISRLYAEVRVASHLLDARDHAADREWIRAAVSVGRASAHARAFVVCLLARYGPYAGRLH